MQFQPDQHSDYRIISALNHNMVLDVTPHPHVFLFQWHNGGHQRFKIQHAENGKYAIYSVQHNTIVSVPDESSINGQRIQTFKSNNNSKQLWQFIPCDKPQYFGKNAYYIKSHCGKALDVSKGDAKNKQQIIQWEFNEGKNQIWFFEPCSFAPQKDAKYKIVSALNKHYVLDISGNPDDHHKLILWKWNGGDNQKFFIHHQNEKYVFVSVASGNTIKVQYENNENGTKLHGKNNNHNKNEQFQLVPCIKPQFTGKGAYILKAHHGKVIDVSGGQCKDGAQIIQWEINGKINQIWFIEHAN